MSRSRGLGIPMELAEKYERSCNALRDYAQAAGFSDIVIGLSGGIDSSLVAKMCVDVFGADHVHGYLLPGPYSTDHSLVDAQDLADNLGIATEIVPIVEPYQAFSEVLFKALDGELTGLASENTQARCRMVCLMAISNHYGWMMINTGNKSEAAMGFSTLYGDTSGAFAPIGGLYKTDVFAICHMLNERALLAGEIPPIPENVLIKPPSAELSPDAKDETAMGIDYATLDQILIKYYEQGVDIPDLVAQGFDEEQVAYVIKRVDGYAFKRAIEPPYPMDTFYE